MIWLIFIGALIKLLFELKKALTLNNFHYITFLEKNGIVFVLNVLIGIGLLFAGVEVELIFMGTASTGVFWLLIGFAGQTIFKDFASKNKPANQVFS